MQRSVQQKLSMDAEFRKEFSREAGYLHELKVALHRLHIYEKERGSKWMKC